MPRLYGLSELNEVSPEVAWKLVDSLFRQNWLLLIGAATFGLMLGLTGLLGTGSFWYLGGSASVPHHLGSAQSLRRMAVGGLLGRLGQRGAVV
jgi:hypothetical protein